MSDYYDDESLYEDVRELVLASDEGAVKQYPYDEKTYLSGMAAKREGDTIGWVNGETLNISDYGPGEVAWLVRLPYELAILVSV